MVLVHISDSSPCLLACVCCLSAGGCRQLLHSLQRPPLQLHRGRRLPAGLCGTSRGHKVGGGMIPFCSRAPLAFLPLISSLPPTSSSSSGGQPSGDGADRAAKVHRVPGADGRVGERRPHHALQPQLSQPVSPVVGRHLVSFSPDLHT